MRHLLPFIATLDDKPKPFRVADAGLVPSLHRGALSRCGCSHRSAIAVVSPSILAKAEGELEPLNGCSATAAQWLSVVVRGRHSSPGLSDAPTLLKAALDRHNNARARVEFRARGEEGQLPSPGMAGEVAEILPFPWAFRQLWKKCGVDHNGVSSAVRS